MLATNEKQPDQKRIVASLASECHLPIGEMAALYEHERAELALGAHITKYLRRDHENVKEHQGGKRVSQHTRAHGSQQQEACHPVAL